MKPAGKVRCNMANQIRLANHNCNFHRLKARVFASVVSLMTHSVCVVANRPIAKTSPRRVGVLTLNMPVVSAQKKCPGFLRRRGPSWTA